MSKKAAKKLLLIELLVLIAISLLFYLNVPHWGASAFGGGLAVWLPNKLFMNFARRHQMHLPGKSRIAWILAFGEAVKVVASFFMLMVAFAFFKAAPLPLIVTWVSVLVVHILAPAVINNKG